MGRSARCSNCSKDKCKIKKKINRVLLKIFDRNIYSGKGLDEKKSTCTDILSFGEKHCERVSKA